MMKPEWENDLAETLALLQALSAANSPLLADTQALANHLYTHWFHAFVEELHQPYPSPGQFVAATASDHLYQPGWTLTSWEQTGVRARNASGGEALLAMGDVAPVEPALPLRPGAALRVIDRAAQGANGFWHLWSAGWRAQAPAQIERLYLGIAPGAELAVAQALAETAPTAEVWYAKFLTGNQPAGRRDSGLLYLPAGANALPWVAAVLVAAAPHLTPLRVRLAEELAPGVSLAQDPGGGRSFGQAICETLALAVGPGSLDSLPRFLEAVQPHLAVDFLPHFVEHA